MPSAGFFSGAALSSSALLKAAAARYAVLTFPHRVDSVAAPRRAGTLSSLAITVDSADESHPQVWLGLPQLAGR